MSKFIILLLPILLVLGCGPRFEAQRQAGRDKTATAETLAVRTECRNKLLSGDLDSHTAEHRCMESRIKAIWSRSGSPDTDLVDVWANHNRAVAKALDAGALSPTEADLKDQEFDRWLTSELSARQAQREQARAARRAAALAIYGITQPSYTPAYRTSTTCYMTVPPPIYGQSSVITSSCY